jgi:hypothetical protein
VNVLQIDFEKPIRGTDSEVLGVISPTMLKKKTTLSKMVISKFPIDTL